MNRVSLELRKVKYYLNNKKIQKKLRQYHEELLTRGTIDAISDQQITYLIHRESSVVGLFSYVVTFLGKMKEGIEEGWKPVIDMQNFPSPYLEPNLLGKENAWEYYFEQPQGGSVEETLAGGSYILSEEVWDIPIPYDGMAFFEDRYGEKTKWRLFAHQYLHIKSEIQEEIEKQYSKMVTPQDRVLGILCRGTDYLTMKPSGHPVQPLPEQVVEKATELLSKWNCNKIYLSTEDAGILQKFQKKFGKNVVWLDRNYIQDTGNQYITEVQSNDSNISRRQNGQLYLEQIAILARCNCLLAGCCSGTVGAVLLSDGYEHEYYWDLGRYE